MEIYLGIENDRKGPFTADQVRGLFSDGKITRNTLAFQTGAAGWTTAGELPGVLPVLEIPPLPGAGIPPLPTAAIAPLPTAPIGDSLTAFLRRAALVTSISTPLLFVIMGLTSTAAASRMPASGAGNLQDFVNQVGSDPTLQNGLVGVGLVGLLYVLSLLGGAVFAVWLLVRAGKGSRLGWITVGIHALCFLLGMMR